MAKVQLNKVGKIYEDEFKAIHNIDLDIEDKEFIVFVGPSGSGKSTTLRMIAGLETISEGELRIGDEVVNNVPAKDRDIAMVFQSYALYPHMNVRDKKIVSILSGGNMDVITMSSVVQQGLIMRDRIFTVSVLLPDKPGELCRVSGIIANANGNVIKLEHNQFVSINRNAAVELRITMEAFGTEHKQHIMEALEKEGYRPKLVRANI